MVVSAEQVNTFETIAWRGPRPFVSYAHWKDMHCRRLLQTGDAYADLDFELIAAAPMSRSTVMNAGAVGFEVPAITVIRLG